MPIHNYSPMQIIFSWSLDAGKHVVGFSEPLDSPILSIHTHKCWRYALEAIMYDDIFYVFMCKDSPWILSMMCIYKYVTYLWDYASYDDCPKRSLVERVVWTCSRLY